MLLARGLEELRSAGAGGTSLPSLGLTWDLLGGALIKLLTAPCLTEMVSEAAEMRKATGTGALKPVSTASAWEETSTAVTPPTSPVSGSAWGGRFASAIVKDVNPEVLRSGVACLPGE